MTPTSNTPARHYSHPNTLKRAMENHTRPYRLFIAAVLLAHTASAQTSDTLQQRTAPSLTDRVFQLGEVTVRPDGDSGAGSRVGRTDMDTYNTVDVPRALDLLPGISATASGRRNESMVSVRGFDLRAVPVYMDGIPVYVPYDGYVDLGRFTTFDLATIDVSKGFSSLLLGPNALGGAINLVSRKPVDTLEWEGAVGLINTNGYRGSVNLGSRFRSFYVQGGYSYLHRDAYPLSDKFDPHAHEDGGMRENSYRTDRKVNLKIGWMPREDQEYVLGFIDQHGEKGNPVYAGDDPLNSMLTKPRYWQWPYWDKTTYYFLSNSGLNGKNRLKARIYYDMFRNSVASFDDSTYSTMKKPYAFQSWYNDYTYGAGLEYGTTVIPRNELMLSVQYKRDVHRENDVDEPVRTFEDVTMNLAVEDRWRIGERLLLIPGVSFSSRENVTAQDFNSATNVISDFASAGPSTALNYQLGAFYDIGRHMRISATASRKTRFATIKDRYSYRMGTAIPNPELAPETSDNFDLAWRGLLFGKLLLQPSAFLSRISDAIISVANVEPGRSQMRNTGLAQFHGVEMLVQYDVRRNLALAANYTYMERRNLTDPDILFTDVPWTKVFGSVQYRPIERLLLVVDAQYCSQRFSSSYGTTAPAFSLLNAMATVKVWKHADIDVGMNNILDENYMLVEGYPEEGRNFFVTLRVHGSR
ncbi:MAG: Vitamin B12 transporter BtuB [Flavobacteriales bacterium]|nr:Vitamin B12 transporter BtuB [Flavobacteriales bacterium]